MTTKTNLQENVMTALESRGARRIENLGKYWKMTHPEDPEKFYFVGKAGALRVGRTVSESISMTHAISAILEEYERGEGMGDEKAATAGSPEATSTAPARRTRENTKQALVLAMLRRPEGATIEDMAAATGWQAHSVRGFLSGALKKKAGLQVTSAKENGRRVYRIG